MPLCSALGWSGGDVLRAVPQPGGGKESTARDCVLLAYLVLHCLFQSGASRWLYMACLPRHPAVVDPPRAQRPTCGLRLGGVLQRPSKSPLPLSSCLSHTRSTTVAQVLDLQVNLDPLRGDVHVARVHPLCLPVTQARRTATYCSEGHRRCGLHPLHVRAGVHCTGCLANPCDSPRLWIYLL